MTAHLNARSNAHAALDAQTEYERLLAKTRAGQLPKSERAHSRPIVAMIAGARCLHAVTRVSSTAQKASDDES